MHFRLHIRSADESTISRICERGLIDESSLINHELSSAFNRICGEIISKWKKPGNQITLDITIPLYATAGVVIPTSYEKAILESGKPVKKGLGVKSSAGGALMFMKLGVGAVHSGSRLSNNAAGVIPGIKNSVSGN